MVCLTVANNPSPRGLPCQTLSLWVKRPRASPGFFFFLGGRPKGRRPRPGCGSREGQQPFPHQLGGLGECPMRLYYFQHLGRSLLLTYLLTCYNIMQPLGQDPRPPPLAYTSIRTEIRQKSWAHRLPPFNVTQVCYQSWHSAAAELGYGYVKSGARSPPYPAGEDVYVSRRLLCSAPNRRGH